MGNIWDGDFEPGRWAQRDQRLAKRDEVFSELIAALAAEPSTAGRLVGIERSPAFDQVASTFLTATWVETGIPAIAKLNVSPWELHWMTLLSERAPDLVPQVLASGDRLGEHGLRWLVLERVPQRLSHEWGDCLYDLLADLAVRFQAAARGLDHRFVWTVCPHFTTETILNGQRAGCPGPLDALLARVPTDWGWLISVCGLEVCVGDLSPGNALCRQAPPGGDQALLIDPIPRVAPWAWDGAYCQMSTTGTDVGLIGRMARLRRERGLHVADDADLERAATILLAWMGARWWGPLSARHADRQWRDQIARTIEAAVVV